MKEVKNTKPKSLDQLPSTDREACQILATVGAFDTSTLISLEYNAEALAKYISMRASLIAFYSLPLLVLTLCMTYLLSLYGSQPVPNPYCIHLLGAGSKMDRQQG